MVQNMVSSLQHIPDGEMGPSTVVVRPAKGRLGCRGWVMVQKEGLSIFSRRTARTTRRRGSKDLTDRKVL